MRANTVSPSHPWRIATTAVGLLLALPAAAQQGSMQGMDMSSMPGMHMPAPKPRKPKAHKKSPAPPAPRSSSPPNTAAPRPAPRSSAQPVLPDVRSPDYSDGYRYTNMRGMDMADHVRIGMLLVDQLEYAHDNHGNNGAFLDAEMSYGEDFDKLWLKAEGDSARGRLEDLRTEVLWNHAIASYWGTELGLRHDWGEGPDRTWAAFGVQGLAPFWFDTEAEVYLGGNGRTAARVQLEYEELITQRLVLQPKFEVNLYGKDDPQRGLGSGLSDSELGVRLRYDIKREFGPYIGVVWRERYGRTATLARAKGVPAGELQLTAGLRFWF